MYSGSVSPTVTCLFSCRGQRSGWSANWVAQAHAGDMQLDEKVSERKIGNRRGKMCVGGSIFVYERWEHHVP